MRFASVSSSRASLATARGDSIGKVVNCDLPARSPSGSPTGTFGADSVGPHPWMRGNSTQPPRAASRNPVLVSGRLSSCKSWLSRPKLPFCPPEVKATWRAFSVSQGAVSALPLSLL